MENITCKKCQTTNDFHVVTTGPHIKAICNNCNQYIKFIPQEKEHPRLYFGKYNGKFIHQIEDLQYLKWALSTIKLKPEIKNAIQKQITSFENLSR